MSDEIETLHTEPTALEAEEAPATPDLGPTGFDAYEPDAPPTKILVATIVGIFVLIGGSYIGLHEYIAAETADQVHIKQGSQISPQLTASRERDEVILTSYAYDEETKFYSVPIEQAMNRLAERPDLASCKNAWPGTVPRTRPEPKEEAPQQ